ncbi:MAG: c-type cytochrome biogenesis protein CcmI [Pseudomonadota bacterium]|nr:c-type cytochrome biogenesis protein CcmI [Pseudomonadota bacterium]
MLLWTIIALLTGAAALAVLWPLARARPGVEAGEADIAVYKDQLREIEADAGRGLIAPAEAAAARVEVARRLLAVSRDRTGSDAGAAGDTHSRGGARRAAALVALVGIPAVALAIYLKLGTPSLPDQPLAARLQERPDNQDIVTLIARVEAHLANNPEDGQGWDVLAPVYLRLGRAADAARAYETAIRLLGPTAQRQASLGEALVWREGGVVTDAARMAFERALQADARNPTARFYLAMAKSQDGKLEAAIEDWRALLAEAPALARLVRPRIAEAEQALGRPASGPTPEQMAEASRTDEASRRAMVEGMVGRLAERLKTDSKDLDGWLRLVRAYAVMGQRDKALGAAEEARRAFAGDQSALGRIDALAKGLGLGS